MLKVLTKNKVALLFIFLVLVSFFMWMIGLSNHDEKQKNIFFNKGRNYFADFYNVSIYCKDNNPYINTKNGIKEKAYFPLTYYIFNKIDSLGKFYNYPNFVINKNTFEILLPIIINSFLFLVFFIQLFNIAKGNNIIKMLLTICLAISGIAIYSFERGNTIILTAICTSFFIINYNNKNKVIREISFISLGVAAALKGMPAVFGVLLLYEKRYKEAIRLILYGFILCFGPFLLINGGLKNIPIWFKNLSINSLEYKIAQYPRIGYINFLNKKCDFELYSKMLKILTVTLSGIGLILSKNQKIKWKKYAFLMCIVTVIPYNSNLYNGLYFFPIILLLINEFQNRIVDFIGLICFILFLLPYQIIIKSINITFFVAGVVPYAIFIILFIDLLYNFAFKKDKNKC